MDRVVDAGMLQFSRRYDGYEITLSDAGIAYAISQGWLTVKRPTMAITPSVTNKRITENPHVLDDSHLYSKLLKQWRATSAHGIKLAA